MLKANGKRVKLWGALAAVLMAGPMPLCLSAPPASPSAQAASSATSPSFDCAKAKSSIESLICKNPELAQLDSSMADAYREAAKRVKPKEVVKLRQEQRRWIQQTRSLCLDATCLKQVYTDRIDMLDKTKTRLDNITECIFLTTLSKNCSDLITYRDPNKELKGFSDDMKRSDPSDHLIGCTLLIGISTGGTLGNKVLAAHCIAENKSRKSSILIQHDLMVGDFFMHSDNGQPIDTSSLMEFIYERWTPLNN